jgi:lysophosphatidate acyltransferase
MMFVTVAISAVTTIIASLALVPIGKGVLVNHVNAVCVKILGRLLVGMNVNILSGKEYLEYNQPTIYVVNHQATLDMYLLGTILPKRCVVTAKKEVMYVPFLGQVFYAGRNMFIDRKNRSNAISAMDSVAGRMRKENLSVLLFPEGTRSHQTDKSLLPFKKGAFHMAFKSKFPIVPIVCSTFDPIYNEKKRVFELGSVQVKGKFSLIAKLSPNKSNFVVLPPIEVGDSSVEELMEKTKIKMETTLKTLETESEKKLK